jgi:hypothetical protein
MDKDVSGSLGVVPTVLASSSMKPIHLTGCILEKKKDKDVMRVRHTWFVGCLPAQTYSSGARLNYRQPFSFRHLGWIISDKFTHF